MKDLINEYFVKITYIKKGPKYWDYLKCDIWQKDKAIIGSYERNYHALYDTFHPFEQDGKHYALYSKDYTSTRIMSLPDCKDLGGEERNQWGFCPVDFYVPVVDKSEEEDECFDTSDFGKFGFVAGCFWGDDSDWKIELLDLREASKGKIIRKQPFGYMPMFGSKIKDNIRLDWWIGKGEFAHNKDRDVTIATSSPTFELDENFDLKYKRGELDYVLLNPHRACKCGKIVKSIMTREIGEPHNVNYREGADYSIYFEAVDIKDQKLELKSYCYGCKSYLSLKGEILNGLLLLKSEFDIRKKD